jgi:hypothetical protein
LHLEVHPLELLEGEGNEETSPLSPIWKIFN